MSFNANIVIGALLVGTWANSMLYAVEVMQAVEYYRRFKHDTWMLKVPSFVLTVYNSLIFCPASQLLVSSVIAIDSVSMIANYASVYLYTITHWGDPAYLQNQYWASHLVLLEET
ncbi:hypothetical protein C8R45DRAFT_1109038 [Mycena sanguinolenta]|nr:hypothetical protein C8R45DRAFT_1109038 [Mycena sanguinolenta]